MLHVPFPRRLIPVPLSLLAAAVAFAPVSVPVASAQTAGTTTTTPTLPLPTTAPQPAPAPAPAATTTTTAPKAKPKPTTTTTAKPGSTGVPPVPVGGPPTTAAPPGAPPPPPPDPTPILTQVDGDLDQIAAINDYKPAQALVAAAQSQVTAAGATLLSARQALDAAKAAQADAAQGKASADGKLRQMAIAAYIGVGYSTPGLNQPANGNGDQGAGTVSTPGGLTGISAIDAKEMLIIVGQHARQNDDDAVNALKDAGKATRTAQATYRKDQAAVGAAEAQLLAVQQTLKLVTAAAMTPGAAAATPLPNLTNIATGGPAAQSSATTTATTSTTAAAVTGASAGTVNGTAPVSPPILGPSVLDAGQILGWWNTLNRQPNITVPIDQLINSYATWGAKLGVRFDVAFAQSVIETGYFSFPSFGQLTNKDNNFAGIGACDTCAHGWTFPTADTGVEAQLELLREFATNAPLPTGVQNVIGGTGVGGCCATWVELAGKWASSIVYGISIMTVYDKMLTWAIPQDEVAVGLIAPSGPTAKGPALAPLPGSTTTTTAPKAPAPAPKKP